MAIPIAGTLTDKLEYFGYDVPNGSFTNAPVLGNYHYYFLDLLLMGEHDATIEIREGANEETQ